MPGFCRKKENLVACEAKSGNLEEQIRLKAYLKWMAETNGEPTSEEESQRIWCEAEREVIEGKVAD